MSKRDDYFEDVKAFHNAFGHPVADTPQLVSKERVQGRSDWLQEEVEELRDAKTIEEQADAFIDILYFAFGGLVELGLQPKPLFDIVHGANMAKLWEDGQPRYREDGKVQKPPSWKDPAQALIAEIERQKWGAQ